tara:strand:+ start:2660 stop:4303 length:1644 start_codon:yes stop_codon:yes gene_type:complete
MIQQPLNAEQPPEDSPINVGEMDFAFLSAGDPTVEPYDQLNKMQENLDQEEQQEISQLVPYVERFFILSYKAENGEYPPEPNTGNTSVEQYNSMLGENSAEQLGMMENPQQEGLSGTIPKSQFDKTPSSIPSRTIDLEPLPQDMQLGGQIQPQPQEQAPQPQAQQVASGPIGEVQVEGKDSSGVADDVQTKSDGYVLSKGAVTANGKMYINDLIDEAIQRLKEKGIELDTQEIPESAEDILISNGEIMIPDIIAQEIGYARLEKMNKRGEKITEELLAEKGQEKTIAPPVEEGFASPEPQGFNEGGELTGQEQYVEGMQEKIKLLDEEAVNTDPNIETIHIDQFPAESPDEKIYQYPKETVKSAMAQHEWKNQDPKYAFVGLSKGMKSSAYGPGQIIGSTMGDMIDRNVFGKGELKNYAEKINAAQNLFFNYWANEMGIEGADTPLGKASLKKLGINREQFQKYVDEGYFTPSNKKNAQERNIPQELLGKNSDRNYDFLWDVVIKEKTKRKTVTGINTFLTAYHGSRNSNDNGRYVKAIRDILDRKD